MADAFSGQNFFENGIVNAGYSLSQKGMIVTDAF